MSDEPQVKRKPRLRYELTRAFFGQWLLRTELDWYVKPTREEALALLDVLQKEFERDCEALELERQKRQEPK